ncbi:MAG: DNA-binding protein [Desulforhopalus sp.]
MRSKIIFFLIAALFAFNPAFLSQNALAMPKTSTPSDVPTASGTIIETMNASGYTYMLIENQMKQTWVAIPGAKVETGETVSYYEGIEMKNFNSKSLNRTFETVIFSPGLADQKAADTQNKENPKQPAPTDSFTAAIQAEKENVQPDISTAVSGGSAGAIAPLEEISIEKATGDNGYTVEEIFEKAKQLAGEKVRVQGKVVKFSPMIMGKNWIHIQDGTGDPLHNTHDLVVTTGETVAVDSIVTIEGQLAAEKDFGAGYKYSAIVEDAAITN